ncbi:MAG: ATP-dependent DNA helicase RecG [Candidatus Eisenbacteria bacterium RBG_16_71_46]|nr:MAG: ATP-dependent DNA helicase RecG [Candidatus Eisenbacteria bacterium RBG_16_71_46]
MRAGPPGGASPAPARRRLEPGTRIQFLPGIGPKRAQLFERLELVTLEHLMRHYPRAYLDARRFVPIAALRPGELLTVSGTVRHAAALRTRGGRADFVATLEDDSGTVGCYFFGQPFLARTLKPGVRVVVSGELDPIERRLFNPLFEVFEGDLEELLDVGRLVPVHPLTRGVTARGMRRAVRLALDAAAAAVADPVPAEVARAHGLGPLAEALEQIHFPDDDARLATARRRLAFEELFLLQTVLEVRRRALGEQGRGLSLTGSGALVRRAIAALPFTLTPDQAQALEEIEADLRAPRPMHRLLLGDVGSGKTVVALLAALHAIEGGLQAAFMAPTEILVRQHAATLARLAVAAGVEIVTLTAATPTAERRAVAARLQAGEPLLAVGTHALLEEKVRMPRLGLAIVDEQHRFGVRQRATLAHKGVIPDVLVLTATPIPRSLALAYYGDLEVSRLRARPPGRGRLVTRIAGEQKFPQVIEFMAREIGAGRQAFVVVPVIEEGARVEHRAAEVEFERLSQHPLLRGFRAGLLHGRLRPDAKQQVMEEFASGAIQMLVATSVVEVGVDVPNASLMVIENADHFGLTQLHQLRGRVGRGEHRAVCVLVPGPGAGALARERLEVLTRTDDGFAIAEEDLRLRGPGELWGTRQSGLPRLRLADLRDEPLLLETQAAARAAVQSDPRLAAPEHGMLRETLLARYSEPLALALAG